MEGVIVNVGSMESMGGEQYLTSEDREYIETLVSAKRKREVTQWRALLRKTLAASYPEVANNAIHYHSSGAPYLTNAPIYISVSHSSYMVAIALSEQSPIGIDIECCTRDFERVASRYTTPFEISGVTEFPLPTIWAAKEALYKVAAVEGIDLVRDISLREISHQRFIGTVLGREYQMERTLLEDHILIYTLP